MTKLLFFLYRRSDMTPEAFLHYSRDIHVPLVARVPGLVRYAVNHVLANPAGSPLACDAVAELSFASMESFQEALTTPEAAVALADQANYLDMARTHMLIVEELAVR